MDPKESLEASIRHWADARREIATLRAERDAYKAEAERLRNVCLAERVNLDRINGWKQKEPTK